ncbi:mucin-3A-like isoform X14 [Myxocyprinus asiaticus]|uniref:mucin-3A-like isoform X14 n=1 Tax=Myxocyprinus asiaticus TaxID=70543 RepID=UPI00222258C4|nr:mucin-3A-like isoform X14 [Myxocyprinus asiaticus]
MKQIVFMFLLLYWNTQSARSEIFSQSVTEGDNAFLYCKHEGKVVWSKDRDGQRRTILSVQNEEIKKYIDDPHNRYRVLSDLSLHIKSVSLSDSGIYNCNENTVVNLTVTASVTPITTVISQRSTVKESKSTQSNTHPQFTSTVTPITTVISQRSTVKESKSTQSNTHPQFTSAVTPITTVSSQRSTVKESKSTQSNTHPKFTSTVTPITTVISQSVKESKSTQSNTHPKFTSADSVGVIVAVSCGVVFVALVLLILACIKRKGFDSLDGPTNKYTHPKFTSTPDEEYSFVVYHRI